MAKTKAKAAAKPEAPKQSASALLAEINASRRHLDDLMDRANKMSNLMIGEDVYLRVTLVTIDTSDRECPVEVVTPDGMTEWVSWGDIAPIES